MASKNKVKNEIVKGNYNLFPIEKYDFSKFSENNSIMFTGSPIQHPYESDKFILITDPVSDVTEFYEFYKKDLLLVEDMPSILSKKGESISISKLWIKKGVVGFKFTPFVVR